MALTKEFEYDCEVRGVHKSVQVRKATIIKDGDEEVSRTYHRHILYCRTKTDGLGATQTFLAKMHRCKLYATPCGLLR